MCTLKALRTLMVLMLGCFTPSMASAGIFESRKVDRPNGINVRLHVAIHCGAEYYNRKIPINPTSDIQDREGDIPCDRPILLSYRQGHLPGVRGKRTKEKNPVIMAWRNEWEDHKEFRVLDRQNRHTEKLKDRDYRSEDGWHKSTISTDQYSGILQGVIYPDEFEPGDWLDIVVDYDRDQDPIMVTLVVTEYPLEQWLQLKAAAQNPEAARALIEQGGLSGPTQRVPADQNNREFRPNGREHRDSGPENQPRVREFRSDNPPPGVRESNPPRVREFRPDAPPPGYAPQGNSRRLEPAPLPQSDNFDPDQVDSEQLRMPAQRSEPLPREPEFRQVAVFLNLSAQELRSYPVRLNWIIDGVREPIVFRPGNNYLTRWVPVGKAVRVEMDPRYASSWQPRILNVPQQGVNTTEFRFTPRGRDFSLANR